MRILIADQSQLRLARMRRQIISALRDWEILEASTLTDTYHLAEHNAPECLVIAKALADRPEFELLASLLKIMHIRCLVWSNDVSGSHPHPALQNAIILPESEVCAQLKCTDRPTFDTQKTAKATQPPDGSSPAYQRDRLILVGASTGGIDALLTVTQHFNEDCPPMLVVQHTGGSFAQSLIRLLDRACPAKVLAAEDGMPVAQGCIYLVSDNRSHLTLASSRDASVRLQQTPAIMGHRPSIDALFTSALPHAARVSAALLTGMGKDGACGLARLRKAGAYTIGQDQRTSVVYGMPRVAMEMGGVCAQLPIGRIGPALLASCQRKRSA